MLASNVIYAINALALLSLIGSASAALKAGELTCLDEDGAPVDWFIAYKFPKVQGDNELFESGVAYAYLASNDVEQEDDRIIRKTDDPESNIFLHHFRDSLIRFAGVLPSSATTSTERTRKGKAGGKKLKNQESASSAQRWTVSKIGINDPNSVVMRTLAPAYEEDSSVDLVYYNDDPTETDETVKGTPDEHKTNMKRAHAKGSLLMDEKNNDGIWLTHSTPRFPKVRSNKNEFPQSGTKNAQTFMCISFNLAESGAKVIRHLYNMRPLVYDRSISDALLKRFSGLKYLKLYKDSKGQKIPTVPKLSQMITTKEGQVLNLFSKSLEYDQDLYGSWIDEELGADLYVETWRNGGGGVLNSSCPPKDHHVNNVVDLKYSDKIQWSYLKDHSKWAITDEEEVATVCIGDINRMASQFSRGGGAVCIKCPTCWSVFSGTIQDTEPCPARKDKPTKRDKHHNRGFIGRIKDILNL